MRAPVLGNEVCEGVSSDFGRHAWTHLEETDGDAHGDARASLRALVARHGPRVLLELLEDACQAVLALRDGEEEAGGAKGRGGRALGGSRAGARARGRGEPEHLLDSLGRVLLGATEHERLGALGVAQLVHLGLRGSGRVNGTEDGPWCHK